MAETLVYPGFVNGEFPSNDYLDKARPALESRVVLAGNRLADLLISIYSSPDINENSEAEEVFLQ